jgi:protein-S-isoprenylcysteine O-methyltransferase Ste14
VKTVPRFVNFLCNVKRFEGAARQILRMRPMDERGGLARRERRFGYRMRLKENAPKALLGEDYLEYVKRTKRLIPFVI